MFVGLVSGTFESLNFVAPFDRVKLSHLCPACRCEQHPLKSPDFLKKIISELDQTLPELGGLWLPSCEKHPMVARDFQRQVVFQGRSEELMNLAQGVIERTQRAARWVSGGPSDEPFI